MTQMQYTVTFEAPSAKEFTELRRAIGWGEIDLNIAQMSLEQSLFHVVVRNQQTLIGMARVVGDGYMYFYLQDVIVHPNFQQQGIGQLLMEHVERFLSRTAKKGATVGLLSAKGKEEFYTRFGYIHRPNDELGHGMCKFI